MKIVDVDLGGKDISDLPKSHRFYNLINADKLQREHFDNPPLMLVFIYKKLTQKKMEGQSRAAFDISKVVRDHICAIKNPNYKRIKINPLIVGPTGVGKTYSIQLASKIVGLPYVEFKMAQVTPLPIKGNEKLPRSLERLIENTVIDEKVVKENLSILKSLDKIDEDTFNALTQSKEIRQNKEAYNEAYVATQIYLAERGIIFLDEIDKIAYTGKGNEVGTKELVQNELLDYLGGQNIRLDTDFGISKKLSGKEINTSKILFFLAGAFSDIDKISKGEEPTIDDLKKYGIKSELLGRSGEIVFFRPLTKKNYEKIINESVIENDLPLRDLIIAELQNDFPNTHISDSAVKYMATKAEESGLGARYLKSIAGTLSIKVLRNLLYTKGLDCLNDHVNIDEEFLKAVL
ncbi:MAG: AAA family ATPase [Bacteroidota bacterium]